MAKSNSDVDKMLADPDVEMVVIALPLWLHAPVAIRAMEAGKQVKKLPMTFGDALDALEEDEVVKDALPGDMYRVFMHYKRDEWERHCAQVSDWDVKEYLDVLP